MRSANIADMASRILFALQAMGRDEEKGCDMTKTVNMIAGLYVEAAYLFDDPTDTLYAGFEQLAVQLQCDVASGMLGANVLPPATIIDFDSEMGRGIAREFFEEWLDCPYDFYQVLHDVTQMFFTRWEPANGVGGQSRAESLRLLVEMTCRAMAYEVGAQELCDAVVEEKIGLNGWDMASSVSGLAGLAGRKLSRSHGGRNQMCWFRGSDWPDLLDQTAYVMTQEAVRLGTPTGPDWRFGLPANDVPSGAPFGLVDAVEPFGAAFFKKIGLHDEEDQAICAAKAAGRMLALACAGELPELEPSIAKPLAMAALTDTYKNACVEYAAVAY